MEGSPLLCVAGILLGWLVSWAFRAIRLGSFHQQARVIILEAERSAREVQEKHAAELRERTLAHETKVQADSTFLEKERAAVKQEKKKLQEEAASLKKEITVFERTKQALSDEKTALQRAQAEAQKNLESTAKLTFEEAKKELWLQAEAQYKRSYETRLLEWQTMYEQECHARASSILFSALERKTLALTRETFLSEIPLSEKFIPKLIGKEGRNIHTLENLLGVTLLVDEHEKKVWISAHDPKRRALATATLERVLEATRVTPVTVKEAYESTVLSLAKMSEEKGRDVCNNLHIQETFPPDVLRSLGELSFRSTAGQNALLHSVEVAELMSIVAKELGFCSEKAKVMGLFHDIGKVLSTEWGTSHALAGAKFLKNFGLEEVIVQAVASHHGETLMTSQEAKLLPLCDRLSAELLGARQDQESFFLPLVHECEDRAKKVQGVHAAWAHYAGNHIELMIRPVAGSSIHPLQSLLEQAFASVKLRLPVKISIMD